MSKQRLAPDFEHRRVNRSGRITMLRSRATCPMKLGPYGEKVAAKFLKRAGYRILHRNYCCPAGEIDIVAADGDTLVFVEVKTRASNAAGDPEASVHFHKRHQITRVARFFVAQSRAEHLPARFDVLSIVVPEKGKPEIEHFIDAFAPTPR